MLNINADSFRVRFGNSKNKISQPADAVPYFPGAYGLFQELRKIEEPISCLFHGAGLEPFNLLGDSFLPSQPWDRHLNKPGKSVLMPNKVLT